MIVIKLVVVVHPDTAEVNARLLLGRLCLCCVLYACIHCFHDIDLLFCLASPFVAVDTEAFLMRLCRGCSTICPWPLFPVDTQLIWTPLSRHGGYTMDCRGGGAVVDVVAVVSI